MKKELMLTLLFACATAISAWSQPQVYAQTRIPPNSANAWRHAPLPEQGVAFGRPSNSDVHCDCHKCQKGGKGKNRHGCGQNGNHYGKHKKNTCSCDHRCQSGRYRGHDDRDDDRRYGRSGRDRDNDDRYRTPPRQPQRDTPSQTQTRPAPSTKPAPARPGAGTKSMPRPRPGGSRY